MKTTRALTAALRRCLSPKPHVHDPRPDWIDTDDLRCHCGAHTAVTENTESGAR